MVWTLIIAAGVLLADRLSKYWAEYVLKPVGDIPLWQGVFHFHYAQNTGAAFSMFEGYGWLFLLMTLAVASAILFVLIRYRHMLHITLKIVLGLLMAGALGNAIDRILYGYVIDFMYFRLINFAIFNVADASLVCGCILLAIYTLFIHDKITPKTEPIAQGAAQDTEIPSSEMPSPEPVPQTHADQDTDS